jgi:predicted kinase
VKRRLAAIGKAVLPDSVVDEYRRRRALRRYLRQLGYELYNRRSQLDPEELEGRLAAAREGFSQNLVKDVLERTDLVLQALDRRIEGLTARQTSQVGALETRLAELRAAVDALRAEVARQPAPAPAGPGPD